MPHDLRAKVEKYLGAKASGMTIVKLHGDASYRTYYRANLKDGSSVVIMEMPPGRASASEEITNLKDKPDELPFIDVGRYLARRGIAVPAILHHDKGDNIIILEDLGDNILCKTIDVDDISSTTNSYMSAIDLLTEIQKKTASNKDPRCVAFRRSFDETLLNWEFDHFLEYGVEARLGLKVDDADRSSYAKFTRSISDKIAKLPYLFTHRDYQSRNIIIRDGVQYIIDFQDALLGPRVYDLVALLRDSYIVLDDDTVNSLVTHYAMKAGYDKFEIRAEFDLVTVQRKLKDAGRFVYIERVKGNDGFLKYIPASLRYVRAAFGRLEWCDDLRALLERYIPEWR